MRHLKAGRKLNRKPKHRRALLRNLVTSLLEKERVKTTDAKAKEVKRLADKVVTLGKRGTLEARRKALRMVTKRSAVNRLFREIAPRFADRHGGYTRVIKVGFRPGDAAPMSVVEFTATAPKAQKEGEAKESRGRGRRVLDKLSAAVSGEKEKG